jgi:hypothetical protein
MAEFAIKLLQRMGFVKPGVPHPGHPEVDFSGSVRLSSTGQARVPVEEVIGTLKFQHDLALLEKVADAHRKSDATTGR